MVNNINNCKQPSGACQCVCVWPQGPSTHYMPWSAPKPAHQRRSSLTSRRARPALPARTCGGGWTALPPASALASTLERWPKAPRGSGEELWRSRQWLVGCAARVDADAGAVGVRAAPFASDAAMACGGSSTGERPCTRICRLDHACPFATSSSSIIVPVLICNCMNLCSHPGSIA